MKEEKEVQQVEKIEVGMMVTIDKNALAMELAKIRTESFVEANFMFDGSRPNANEKSKIEQDFYQLFMRLIEMHTVINTNEIMKEVKEVLQELTNKGVDIPIEYEVIIEELLQSNTVSRVVDELLYVLTDEDIDAEYLVYDIAFDRGIDDCYSDIEYLSNPYIHEYLKYAWNDGWNNV